MKNLQSLRFCFTIFSKICKTYIVFYDLIVSILFLKELGAFYFRKFFLNATIHLRCYFVLTLNNFVPLSDFLILALRLIPVLQRIT